MTEMKMAMLYGMMLGDGWLSITQKSGLIGGFSGDAESLEVVKSDLLFLGFDIGKATIISKETESPKYNIKGISSYFVITKSACERFIKAGMTTGKKVETEFLIPEWITNGDTNVKRAFLSGLYSAEGYTPAMQGNDKTVKTLGLNITKRYALKNNFQKFLNQLSLMLNELKIEHNIKLKETFTCDRNFKAIITFDNSLDNILRVTSLLNLRYCKPKEKEFKALKKYYSMKQDLLSRLINAHTESKDRSLTARSIADKYKISQSQVENWRREGRENMKVGIPNNFPTYTKFKTMLSTINSVNSGKA